jgi:hypothetical protein
VVAALILDFTQLGCWVGHGMELAGIACVGGAVALDLPRGVQSRALIGDLRGSELVSEEEAFLGSQIRALTVRLAEKDTYTEEHTRRVALHAVQVGEELGLAPGHLRTLAVVVSTTSASSRCRTTSSRSRARSSPGVRRHSAASRERSQSAA